MITIVTGTSRIKSNGGVLATGQIIIQANDEFEFTDTGGRVKVTTDPVVYGFTSGLLDDDISIAPTLNASQDKTNLYYTVQFITALSKWTEYWVIDADGGASLEITAVTKVIVNPVASTVDYIPSDDVSVDPIADGIPRADENGILDSGWLVAGGGTLVYQFTGHPLPTPPAGVTIAIGYDSVDDQSYVYAGGRWRIVGG